MTHLRRTLRRFSRAPGYTLVAVATLGLGIGAIAAVFSVVHAVLLEPLPYEGADRLVRLYSAYPEQGLERGTVSPIDLEDWREQSRRVESMGGFSAFPIGGLVLTGDAAPVALETSYVTPGFFETLAVPALHGRTLAADDHVEGRNRRIVLSHGAWQRHFGGDPALARRTVTLSGEPFTVVGVMPEGFEFPDGEVDAWAPTSLIPPSGIPRERFVRWLGVVGRLAEDAPVEAAASELGTIVRRLAVSYPDANEGLTAVTVRPLRDVLLGPVRPALLAVFGGVAILLLIACGNVANISLARTERRSGDLVVQAALGASHRRIAGDLVLETLILGLFGGIVGLGLGAWGVQALIAAAPPDLPRLGAVGLDIPVLAFTSVICLLAGLLAGLAPAWRTRRLDLVSGLKEGVRGIGREGSGRGARHLLLVGQICLVALLAIGGSLTLRSYQRLLAVDPGFEPESVLTLGVHAAGEDYREFLYEALERVREVPGVEAAGMVRPLPLGPETFQGETFTFTIPGRDRTPAGEELEAHLRVVSPGYFRAMGIPLLAGREFTERDALLPPDAPLDRSGAVLIVSRAAAERYWPRDDPVGSRIRIGDAEAEVVGVAGDVRQTALSETPEPAVYAPHRQVSRRGMTIVVRGSDPTGLAGPVQRAIWDLRPDQPIENAASLGAVVSRTLARPRFAATLLSVSAGLALALAAVGVYGVVGYSVARRRHEIGIRRALGARRGQVFGGVLGHGVRLAGTGMLLGVLVAAGTARVLETLLYEVAPLDAGSFAFASLLLLCVAAGAAAIPAARACRVDPVTVMRDE